eukprot:m.341733 g.341733  ORF g.341733 m.341733 type:complete len:1629 (-) comp20450_c0_seq1:158-5044(-)
MASKPVYARENYRFKSFVARDEDIDGHLSPYATPIQTVDTFVTNTSEATVAFGSGNGRVIVYKIRDPSSVWANSKFHIETIRPSVPDALSATSDVLFLPKPSGKRDGKHLLTVIDGETDATVFSCNSSETCTHSDWKHTLTLSPTKDLNRTHSQINRYWDELKGVRPVVRKVITFVQKCQLNQAPVQKRSSRARKAKSDGAQELGEDCVFVATACSDNVARVYLLPELPDVQPPDTLPRVIPPFITFGVPLRTTHGVAYPSPNPIDGHSGISGISSIASGMAVKMPPGNKRWSPKAGRERIIVTGGKDARILLWKWPEDARKGMSVNCISDEFQGGHSDEVRCLSIANDGMTMVSASTVLLIWDLVSRNLLHRCKGHTAFINDLKVTEDSKWVVSCSLDKTFKIWCMATGTCERSILGHGGPIHALSIVPVGVTLTVVTASGDKSAVLWELQPEKTYFEVASGYSKHRRRSWSEGARSPSAGSLALRAQPTQDEMNTFDSEIKYIQVSPDGKRAAAASRDARIKLLSLDPADQVGVGNSAFLREVTDFHIVMTTPQTQGSKSQIRSVLTQIAFSKCSNMLVAANMSGCVMAWGGIQAVQNTQTMEDCYPLLYILDAHGPGAERSEKNRIRGLVVERLQQPSDESVEAKQSGPPYHVIVTGGVDGFVKIWPLIDKNHDSSKKDPRFLTKPLLEIGPRFEKIGVGRNKAVYETVKSTDQEDSPQKWKEWKDAEHDHAVISVTTEIGVLEEEELKELDGVQGCFCLGVGLLSGRIMVYKVLWKVSPEGDIVLKESLIRLMHNHSKGIWYLASQTIVPPVDKGNPNMNERDVVYLRLLAAASRDETISIWDFRKASLLHVLQGHTGPLSSVCFSSMKNLQDEVSLDYCIISSSFDTSIRVWPFSVRTDQSLEFDQEHVNVVYGHYGAVRDIDAVPGGSYFLSGAVDDRLIMWDLENRIRRNFEFNYQYIKDVLDPSLSREAMRGQAVAVAEEVIKVSPHTVFRTRRHGRYSTGETIIHTIAKLGDTRVLELLLNANVKTNIGQHPDRMRDDEAVEPMGTFLRPALENTRLDCVKLILENLIKGRQSADGLMDQTLDQADAQWTYSLDFQSDDITKDLIQLVVIYPNEAAKFLKRMGLVRVRNRVVGRYGLRTFFHKPDNGSRLIVYPSEYHDEPLLWERLASCGVDDCQTPSAASAARDSHHGVDFAFGETSCPKSEMQVSGLEDPSQQLLLAEPRVVPFPGAAKIFDPPVTIGASHGKVHSLLEASVGANMPELFDNLTMKAIIAHKWREYGKRRVLRAMFVFTVQLCLLVSLLYMQLGNSNREDLAVIIICMFLIVGLMMDIWTEICVFRFPFLAPNDRVVQSLISHTIPDFIWSRIYMFKKFLVVYFINVWNSLHFVLIIFEAVTIGMVLGNWHNYGHVALGLTLFLKVFASLFFLQPFSSFGYLIHMIEKVIYDIFPLIIVLAITLFAPGFALFSLYRRASGNITRPDAELEEFQTFQDSLFTQFLLLMMQEFPPDVFFGPGWADDGKGLHPYSIWIKLVFIISCVFISIILLNLTIGAATVSYDEVVRKSESTNLMLRGRMILRFESMGNRRCIRNFEKKNSARYYPEFLHVLIPAGSHSNETGEPI